MIYGPHIIFKSKCSCIKHFEFANFIRYIRKKLLQLIMGPEKFDDAIRLYSTNKECTLFNELKLCETLSPIAISSCLYSKAGRIKITDREIKQLLKAGKGSKSTRDVLYLCGGAKVMLWQNLWTSKGLVNGSMGIVKGLLFKDREEEKIGSIPAVVLVEFFSYIGPALLEHFPKIVPIVPSEFTSPYNKEEFKRTQLPLCLAWAITIHKSQGLILSKAVINLGESEQTASLTFVALPRVRQPEDYAIETG